MATVEFDLWVARDEVDNKLFAFNTKPFKNEEEGRYYEITGKMEFIKIQNITNKYFYKYT